MNLKLRELTLKNKILQVYEIYKHCMFMPTEEKFNNKKTEGKTYIND